MLELDGKCQNGQFGELSGLSTYFICSVYYNTVAGSKSTDELSLLDKLISLWANSSTDIDKFHSAPPIQVQMDLSELLPRIN